MPQETQDAVSWALQQQYEIEPGYVVQVSDEIPFTVVDKVREYFNDHDIQYESFSFNDLITYL